MADTRIQLDVEDWVRDNWMREKFGKSFNRRRLRLSSGGVFDFDAVSDDGLLAASISTSASVTSGGKNGSGKMMKLRSDMLFLLMAEQLDQRLIILTEPTMFAKCEKEKSGGRVPKQIDFLLAEIPFELESKLTEARQRASREVSPQSVIEQLPDEILLKSNQSS